MQLHSVRAQTREMLGLLQITFLVILNAALVVDGWSSMNSTLTIGSADYPAGATPYMLIGGVETYIILALQVPDNTSGLLFAFTAYFRVVAEFELHVWRPVDHATLNPTFRRIWTMKVKPVVVNGTEDIYPVSKFVDKCAFVQGGDWIGAYQPVVYTPIAAIEDLRQGSSLLYTKVTNVTGNIYTYDQLKFPLRFLLAAHILVSNDTDSNSTVDLSPVTNCSRELRIPSPVVEATTATTSEPITANVGATGERGVTGLRGVMGQLGATGIPGPTVPGVIGQQGLIGSMGATGYSGWSPAGENGTIQGENGTIGGTGYTGLSGDQGLTGATGPLGPPGVNMSLVWDDSWLYAPLTFWYKDDPMIGIFAWLAASTAVLLAAIVIAIVALCLDPETRAIRPDDATNTNGRITL